MIPMIKAAIIGYGNIGKYVLEAMQASGDIECIGIVRRNASGTQPVELNGLEITDHVTKLSQKPDVAVLAAPTRSVEKFALECLENGINTVDSFDIHGKIWDLKNSLDQAAKKNDCVSVISAGWDPGSDSVVRTLMQACSPKGLTYTNFGPGMSMGHTVAVKAIEGVKNALSMTIPLGTSIHRRMVYIELKDGYVLEEVAAKIKADAYFAADETHVMAVDSVADVMDMGHGVNLTRKGVSGKTPNQLFEFDMKINNPALTGQVLVAAARASMKQRPGAYTMIEIPVIDLLEGEKETLIRHLV
ncbi:MAG: diaminopimelate dehydrogenase [Oscillospiraceae bacterium]